MNTFFYRKINSFLSPLLGLCLLLAPGIMQAAKVDLSDITERTPIENQLRGKFIQSKKLSEIPFPIVSTGHFDFDSSTGLHWNTLHPITNQLLISRTHILQFENGKEVFRMDVESNPLLGLIGSIFVAAMTGDYQMLEQHFDIQPSLLEIERKWKLSLTPKQSLLKSFSEKIEIFGDTQIEKLILYDTSGDVTLIKLHSFSAGPTSE